MVAGWGVGKTMVAIIRGLTYAELIPNSTGMIFRKEFTDLRDSTIVDFQELTGKKLNSHRNYEFENGSLIMFRHIQEVNSNILQNVNLTWFFIEQAEELPTDEQFFLLWGRLRQQREPLPGFLELGLPRHSGWITANVKGRNWIRTLWKDNPQAQAEGFHLVEAVTADNFDVLPADFRQRIEQLQRLKPDMYRRFCLNDWDVEVEGRAITPELIEACIGGEFAEPEPQNEYILGVDLAKHTDFTVIMVAEKESGQIVFFDRFNKESWALVRGKIAATAKRYNDAEVIPDSTGVGDPITEDLERAGCRVYHEKERPGYVFTSRSKEQLIENLIVTMTNRGISYPRIPELIDELKNFERSETPSGNVRYSAPEGQHDDCVIALALCCWGLPHIMEGIPVAYGHREMASIEKDF
jgi:hypothetical protein